MFIIGLDNGFCVKSNKRELTRKELPEIINYPFEEKFDTDGIEIVYWRKNWGLRNAVMYHFGWYTRSPEEWQFEMNTPAQVLDLIEIIASWLDEYKWNNYGDSIWEYKEIRPVLLQNIINLTAIHGYMLTNPDVYLEFYDSY